MVSYELRFISSETTQDASITVAFEHFDSNLHPARTRTATGFDSQWTVPINVQLSQLTRVSGQPVSFAMGARFYAERPAGGPDWGLRFTVTLLLPK